MFMVECKKLFHLTSVSRVCCFAHAHQHAEVSVLHVVATQRAGRVHGAALWLFQGGAGAESNKLHSCTSCTVGWSVVNHQSDALRFVRGRDVIFRCQHLNVESST